MGECHGTMHSNRYQSSKFIGSSESNLELSDQAGGIYGTGSRCRWGCRPNAGNNDSDAAVASIYLETSFNI